MSYDGWRAGPAFAIAYTLYDKDLYSTVIEPINGMPPRLLAGNSSRHRRPAIASERQLRRPPF